MNKDLRKLAILVLDEDHGISEAAFKQLVFVAEDCQDIFDLVSSSNNRYYLGEDDVIDLMDALEK